ncbi:hypothetical protein OKW41_002233 [Paraburkholderia sp. UCT70]|uniref:adenylyl-sulfate kinase n=1 Tax=Paraburkholderia sp. UCT70 TaxID=2991068 RepID=UPI003D22AA22
MAKLSVIFFALLANIRSRATTKSPNLVWSESAVTRARREKLNGNASVVLWSTGLSGSGKSTLANAVEEQLHQMRRATFLLDGDSVRQDLCRDLGFSERDRIENISRIRKPHMSSGTKPVRLPHLWPLLLRRRLGAAQTPRCHCAAIVHAVDQALAHRQQRLVDLLGVVRRIRSNLQGRNGRGSTETMWLSWYLHSAQSCRQSFF